MSLCCTSCYYGRRKEVSGGKEYSPTLVQSSKSTGLRDAKPREKLKEESNSAACTSGPVKRSNITSYGTRILLPPNVLANLGLTFVRSWPGGGHAAVHREGRGGGARRGGGGRGGHRGAAGGGGGGKRGGRPRRRRRGVGGVGAGHRAGAR
eukprot:2788608-Pyramimonas_sp.AAC.1